MHTFEFLLLCNTLLLCCFIKISILVVTLLLSLAVLMFNILEKLCDLRKCLRVSLKKIIYFIILADKTDIFFCLLRLGLADVFLGMYFMEMLNPLSFKADSYGLFAHSNSSPL